MSTLHPSALKATLPALGLALDPALVADPHLLRDGLAGDSLTRFVDLVLPGGTHVAAPDARIAGTNSPYALRSERGRYFVEYPNGAGRGRVEVTVRRQPAFYGRKTSRGTPMARVATIHGNALVVHPVGTCGFSVHGVPCGFCVEGARTRLEGGVVPVADVVEVVRAAFDERAAELVYFNGGLYEGEDGGLAFLQPYVEAVRKHFDTLVAAQLHPPRTDRWTDRAYAMGVDALSYNLEIFDPDVLGRHCIGRARYIGRDRYLEALGYAATIFPRGTVWTDLVVGIEPIQSTLAGIDALTALGVVPVAALRPRPDGPPAEDVARVLAHLYDTVRRRRIPMGWVRGLAFGVSPIEARHFAGARAGAGFTVALQGVARSRLGRLAVRGLARTRRRLRVHEATEAAPH
jgi:hypothetical protein